MTNVTAINVVPVLTCVSGKMSTRSGHDGVVFSRVVLCSNDSSTTTLCLSVLLG